MRPKAIKKLKISFIVAWMKLALVLVKPMYLASIPLYSIAPSLEVCGRPRWLKIPRLRAMELAQS